MNTLHPVDAGYKNRICASFSHQSMMRTLNAELSYVGVGEIHIAMPYDNRFTQQDGYLHAGTTTTLLDSACGYAAYTLMPADSRVLSVEFKVNLLSPGQGERFRAEGRVIKAGRILTVCEGKLYSQNKGKEKLIAVIQATMICISKGEQS